MHFFGLTWDLLQCNVWERVGYYVGWVLNVNTGLDNVYGAQNQVLGLCSIHSGWNVKSLLVYSQWFFCPMV